MNNKTIQFTNIFNSKLYEKDNDFLIDFLTDEKFYNYDEIKKMIIDKEKINRMLTTDELEKIAEQKYAYYLWEFWKDTEYFQDNINMIRRNFYWDKEHNEIILNYWVELIKDTDWNFVPNSENVFDVDNFKVIYYKKVFDAFCFDKYSSIIETNYIEIVWDWSLNSKYRNLNKPNFVIIYRWGQGYTYSIFEYDLK